MRTTITLAVIAATSLTAGAAKLAPADALAAALADGPARIATSNHPHFALAWTVPNGNVYAFNNPRGGFVIAAGDDSMGASLLGYIDTGSINPALMPPALEAMLKAFSNGHFNTPANAPRENIAPLLFTTWAQDSPYNNDCPMDESGRSMVGCAATAISQVLNHFKYPACGTGIATATVGSGAEKREVSLNLAEHPIDWDNIAVSYGSGATEVQKSAVANLCHVVGMAINMNYSASSSGAAINDEILGLTTHLGFDKGLRSLRRDFYTIPEWNAMCHAELKAGRPIVYNGFNGFGGHCFVVDGYNGDNGEYFHLNWGWNGMSDGYFLLTNLTPAEQGIGGSADGYNKNQEALFGMEPDKGTPDYLPVIGLYGSFGVKSASIMKTKDPEFCATAPGVNNYQGFFNVGLFRENVTLGVKAVDNTNGKSTYIGAATENDMAVLARVTSFTIPASSMPPEGEYTLTPAFRHKGTWYDMSQDATARTRLTLTVTDKRFKFTAENIAAFIELTDVTVDPPTNFVNGNPVKISCKLTAHGGPFGGNIIPVLCQGNTIVTSMNPVNAALEEEESMSLEWNEPFKEELPDGTYNFYIVLEEGFKGLYGPLAVHVGPPGSIESIGKDAGNAETMFYDLQGRRVTRPVSGSLYIVRTGTSATRSRY